MNHRKERMEGRRRTGRIKIYKIETRRENERQGTEGIRKIYVTRLIVRVTVAYATLCFGQNVRGQETPAVFCVSTLEDTEFETFYDRTR
jgi:hypothetical protein